MSSTPAYKQLYVHAHYTVTLYMSNNFVDHTPSYKARNWRWKPVNENESGVWKLENRKAHDRMENGNWKIEGHMIEWRMETGQWQGTR